MATLFRMVVVGTLALVLFLSSPSSATVNDTYSTADLQDFYRGLFTVKDIMVRVYTFFVHNIIICTHSLTFAYK